MHKSGLIVVVSALFVLGVSLPAQETPKVPSESDYSQLMKDIQSAQMNVRKAIASKVPGSAANDAAKLHTSFTQIEAFWKQKNVEDAIKTSGEAVASAAKVMAAAKSGNVDEMQAGFTEMSGTCRTCHAAHRERNADGTYRIK